MAEAVRMERTMLLDWLQHDRLSRRVVAGPTLGLACMYLTWTISYLLLPEGVLRGKTGAGFVSDLVPDSAGVFLLALIWNSMVAFVLIPLVGLLAVGRLSLAYVLAAGHFALFGVFLGTNSFGNPRPEALPPSLSVLTGTGPWEIVAYMLVAAALANRYRFRQRGWLGAGTTRVSRKGERLASGAWATIAAAAILIVTTAWIEHERALKHAAEMAVASIPSRGETGTDGAGPHRTPLGPGDPLGVSFETTTGAGLGMPVGSPLFEIPERPSL